MTDLFSNLALGFSVALLPINLGYCFVGALLGTLVGVLPGIGPLATIAMLLPLTFSLPPETALIMLAGIYYGSQYGGSTTAILLNVPGESSSVVTTLDGHQMARQGRAGEALQIAAIGSLIAGCVATLLIGVASKPLSDVGRNFGAAEYFSLLLVGLICAVALASGPVVKSFAMILLGIGLGLVGIDINTGSPRLTMGIFELSDGIDFIPLAMGLLGINEILKNLEQRQVTPLPPIAVTGLRLNFGAIRKAMPSILRGTAIGSFLGLLPGGGALLSSFASYTVEKKIATDPSRFGKGAIEGVAGPESANNAGAQASFIPMLTLGMPSNVVMAIMLGALAIHGIAPGPQVLTQQPELYWGLIASMFVGNVMLVVINLPLVGVWVRLLSVEYKYLFPAIVMFCCIGVYTINNSILAVDQLLIFTILGYVLYRLDFEPAPLLLGFILGPMLEENLRRAMVISRGDPTVFFTRPISLTLLIIAGFLLVVAILPAARRKRDEIFIESE